MRSISCPIELQLMLRGLVDDVGSAGQLADQHAPLITDALWRNMFIAGGGPIDGMYVHASLVREGAGADKSLSVAVQHVGRLVDIPRKLGQVLEGVRGKHFVALFLKRQIGNHGDQVHVAAAFANSIDRSLDLDGSCIHRRQCVGDG